MKRTLLTLAVVCLFALAASSAHAQLTPAYGNITAAGTTCATANACVTLHLPSPTVGNVSITIQGTFVGTQQFEQSGDNQSTWDGMSCSPQPSGAAVTSATAGDLWVCAVGGATDVRVRGSAYTSGTAAVVIQPTNTSVAGANSPPTGSSATQVQGTAASGAAQVGNPVLSAWGSVGTTNQAVPSCEPLSATVCIPIFGQATAGSDAVVDNSNYPTTGGGSIAPVAVFPFIFNGSTRERPRSAANATDSPGTGIAAEGLLAQLDETATSTVTENNFANARIDSRRLLYVRTTAPTPINCVVAVSTATTIQAVGTSCAAPGAGLSIYITDIEFGSSAASGTAADSFPTLKSGTGGTCGAATAVIWQALTAANTTQTANLTQPIKVTANNEVCWIMSTAGSKTIQIHGFIAP